MKKITKIFAIIITLTIVVVLFATKIIQQETSHTQRENFNQNISKTRELCYSYYHKTDRGFYDKIWLSMKITGDQVTGEFDNYLAEKDSKIGPFSGTVGSLNQNTMSRRADVFWKTYGEGMYVTEELLFDFGDGSAGTLFGETYDRGDGVYVYKDKTKLTPSGPALSQVDCMTMFERRTVEDYVTKNIKTIATNKSVLGGSWNIVSISVNTVKHSGEVVYEDGHIQSTATFNYRYDSESGQITVRDFKEK